MQYDMGRFDQPLVDETQPKAIVWTDIGDAEIEHSIFGNAKVRVHRKRDEVRGALGWTLLTVGLVVGAVWLIKDASRQPEIVHVAPPVPAVAVPQPKKAQPVVAQIKPRVTPPIAMQNTAPQLRAQSASVAAGPVAVVVSGASAPVVAKPAPLAVKPATVAAPVAVMTKPVAPATPLATVPVVTQTPAAAASAVPATN